MLIGKSGEIRSAEITPRDVYFSRRKFLAAGMGLAVGGGALRAATKLEGLGKSPFSTSEKLTPYDAVTTYNNFYEFGSGKDQPARFAKNFQTTPWTVSVEGHAQKPRTFDLDAILALAPIEERIYRMRCVEGWSMVIPWAGYPLSALLKQVDPLSKAKYVAFQSYYNSKQMPQGRFSGIPFPYVEGLRMDEAMHPLTLLCVDSRRAAAESERRDGAHRRNRGNTGSKASNRSPKSSSSRRSLPPPGIWLTPANTASIPT